MTESQFAKQVLKEPNGKIERDGKTIFDGIIVKPEEMEAFARHMTIAALRLLEKPVGLTRV